VRLAPSDRRDLLDQPDRLGLKVLKAKQDPLALKAQPDLPKKAVWLQRLQLALNMSRLLPVLAAIKTFMMSL
jgi:hypothetical protein